MLEPLVLALSRSRGLSVLNLARNFISAKGLDHLLEHLLLPGTIKVATLHISKNRLDDAALLPLLGALRANRIPSLTQLEVEQLELGHDAGEGIGAMLATNTSLTSLNLKWNKLRLLGAERVAQGMLLNNDVTHLDVSWNGFGDMEPLGEVCEVLRQNTTLTHLNLGRNRVRANGCTVLAASLCTNTSLLMLDLDGNPVGAAGAKEMVRLTLPDDDDEIDRNLYGEVGEAGMESESDDAAAAVGEAGEGGVDIHSTSRIMTGLSSSSRVTATAAADPFSSSKKGSFAKKGKDGKMGLAQTRTLTHTHSLTYVYIFFVCDMCVCVYV